ncbi:hypothetical protein RHS01_11195 [Rhizoctonia solani]|uniref:Uncharacterized protein n=1 Tax=Rhizoctonia solani TaxID=456999 RepID=A0A8H7I1Y3_9AGAM|nr:hypothetical protein RHS01_11195 [Rhizoctonia solani]
MLHSNPLPTSLLQHISHSARLAKYGPEPSLTALLKAVTALTATVGSLQDQIQSQGQQLIKLKAICKETADLLGNKDQGGPQPSLAHQLGLSLPPRIQGEKRTLQEQLGLDLRPFPPIKGNGL